MLENITIASKRVGLEEFISLRKEGILPILVELNDRDEELFKNVIADLYIKNIIAAKYNRNLYLLFPAFLKKKEEKNELKVSRIKLNDFLTIDIKKIYNGGLALDLGGFHTEDGYISIEELGNEIIEKEELKQSIDSLESSNRKH